MKLWHDIRVRNTQYLFDMSLTFSDNSTVLRVQLVKYHEDSFVFEIYAVTLIFFFVERTISYI